MYLKFFFVFSVGAGDPGDLLLVFISVSLERREHVYKFWAYRLMLSLPCSVKLLPLCLKEE